MVSTPQRNTYDILFFQVLLEYKQSYVDWLCQVIQLSKNSTFEALKPRDINVLIDDVIKSDSVMQENGGEMDIPILYHDMSGGDSPGSDRNDVRCSTFRSELSG